MNPSDIWHRTVKQAIKEETRSRPQVEIAKVDKAAIRRALRESRMRKTVRVSPISNK